MKTIRQVTLIVIAALLWATAYSAEVSGQTIPTFVFAPQASTGLAPDAVELADMDGDGDIDMVTSNLVDQEFSTVSVSKNNGNGTFAAPVDYPVGPNPKDLRLADFNGDGRPDVVCLAALSGENPGEQSFATVLFNNGTGGLVNRIDYPVGENANSGGIDVGDYTGDGISDFAVASLMTGVYVYRNTGTGTFALWTNFAGFFEPTHIASADFNSDGLRDIIAGNTDDARIYLNNGSGFTAGFTLANFGDGVSGIATGDFDNDGKPDVALTGRNLSVYRNLGGGTSFAKTAYLSGENGTGIKTADMDGDGKLDITVSNSLGNSVSVYSNNGSGQFPDKREWGVGLAPNSHGIGDVNGDGKLDIVAPASNLSHTTVNVVLNAGNRVYVARRDYGLAGAAWGVDFADFNGDGYRDVVTGGVVVGSDQHGPFVFYGKPDGTLQDGIQVDFWTNNSPTDVEVGDFNGDGWPDIVSSIFSPGNRIRVNLNQGNGTFLPSVSYTAGGNPRGIGIGDLNGDGELDIVTAQAALLENDISIFIGNGDGTFQPQVKVDVGFRPLDVLLADFDQNGRSEIIVTHFGSNAIYYFKPNAAGVLGAPQIIDVGSTQGNAVAADFDNDGWLDIMVGAGNAVLLRNNQSGGFVPPLTTPVPATYIAAADWDQDGLMDVVGTNTLLDLALVGWNHGGGNFSYVSFLQAGYETARVGAADLNGDGLPEIVTANLRARSISVFKNTTPSGRTAFDFDGDGKADVSVFRPSSGTWHLLRSQSGYTGVAFGTSGDLTTPADFDGDGKTDIAVFRDGIWYWLNSSNGSFNSVQFGQSGDVPVPADYTGDGRSELAVFRSGIWYTLNLVNSQFNAVQFGISTDKAVSADFDGDGKSDIAVYRDGVWWWLRSSDGQARSVQFGIISDKPVVGDYDGDGRADQAVYRSGIWHVLGSTQGYSSVQFGIASDVPVAADYDGDKKTDFAVYRQGVWHIWRSSDSSYTQVDFGLPTDIPIASAYSR